MGVQDRVWTRARARREGVSRGRLTGGSEFVRVVPGAYLEACGADDPLSRAAAVLHAAPAAVLSHGTTLLAHGLPVPVAGADLVHVTVPAGGSRPRWPGTVAHRSATLRPFDVQGLRATGAVRAWCDAAALVRDDPGPWADPRDGRRRPVGPVGPVGSVGTGPRVGRWTVPTGGGDLADLVAAGDRLLAGRPGMRVDVRNQLSLRPGGRGTAVAERAVVLLDGRAESPQESRLRVLMHLAGLPDPVAQHEVRDRCGRLVARLDLAYPSARLAVEYDGDHHRDRGQWRQDLVRRERLEAQGWRVVVVVGADLLGDPASVVARVRAALAQRVA